MSINLYISNIYDPYINLAIENQLLETINPGELKIFLYTNQPSVVIGRFQNPWQECDVHYLMKNKILLVRRQSGGGTVYHDKQNLNFSFIHPQTDFKKNDNIEMLQKVLLPFDIKIESSNRTDLLVNFNGPKKISGSAFKQKKDKSFHHGTLLINTNIDKLHLALSKKLDIYDSKAIKSNPNKVVNLVELNPKVSSSAVINEFKKHAKRVEYIDSFEKDDYLKLISSKKWIYEETPYFKTKVNNKELTLKKGVVLDSTEPSYIQKKVYDFKDVFSC